MQLEGVIYKGDKFWLGHVPLLDLMVQGKTMKEASNMLKDAIEELVNIKTFKVRVLRVIKSNQVFVSSNNTDIIVALILKRLRQKSGLTLAEVSKRLGSNSPNAFARYEQGKSRPSVAKLQELISAIDKKLDPILKLAA